MSKKEEAPAGTGHEVQAEKQTVLGLYVTSQEAYAMWQANPKGVHIIDVRTPEEYVFVGHAAMARNIPLAYVTHKWDSSMNEFAMQPNAEFVARVKGSHAPTDTILVTCRSGGRSAMAANALAKAGFTKVYNIIDGVEGDKVSEPGSLYHGKRMKNGWKNSGLPWTYDVNPELAGLPIAR